MTALRDATLVDCSVEQTEQRLRRFFSSLPTRDGIAHMRLRVPMSRANIHSISLDREVCIEARPVNDRDTHKACMEITWIPEGSIVFPKFAGRLVVNGNHDAAHAFIELDGHYTPPFGAAGQVFDVTIGRQIAQATVREFLKDLKNAVETTETG